MAVSPLPVRAHGGGETRILHEQAGLINFTAFVLYDYAITLDQEVEMFWKETLAKRKVTGATALFAVNRYLVLFLRLLNLLGFTSMSDTK